MPSVRKSVLLIVCLLVCVLAPAFVNSLHAASSYTLYLPAIVKPGVRSGATIFVAKTTNAVSRAGCGTSSAPCSTISAAVAQANPGDTISVASGVYNEKVVIDAKDGTAQQPITLASDHSARIQSSGDDTALVIKKSYWVVRGFEITPSNGDAHAVQFDTGATYDTLDDNHLFDGRDHGVELSDGSQHNTISNNVIENFNNGNIDAHGIGIRESHYNLIQGNRIFNTSGDAVQVFTIDTPDISLTGRRAIGNRIIGNTMYDSRENAVDVKSSEDTVISDNKMWGYKPSTTSDGMAITVHYWARKVKVFNNEIMNSNWGIEVSRGDKNGVSFKNVPDDVEIHHNYIHDIFFSSDGEASNRGNGAGIVVRESNKVKVWNNTVTSAAKTCMVVTWPNPSSKNPAPQAPSNLQILNNSFSGCGEAELFLRSTDTRPTEWLIDHNHYGSPLGGSLAFGSKVYTLPLWQKAMNYDLHSLTTDGAGIITSRLLPETTLIDQGQDVGLAYCGAAPDIGAFESGCTP